MVSDDQYPPSTRGAISGGAPGRGIHSVIGPDGERLLYVDGELREIHTTPEQRAMCPGMPHRVYLIEPALDDEHLERGPS
jgi:hypothetical protein